MPPVVRALANGGSVCRDPLVPLEDTIYNRTVNMTIR
jgi:hypothetical protein